MIFWFSARIFLIVSWSQSSLCSLPPHKNLLSINLKISIKQFIEVPLLPAFSMKSRQSFSKSFGIAKCPSEFAGSSNFFDVLRTVFIPRNLLLYSPKSHGFCSAILWIAFPVCLWLPEQNTARVILAQKWVWGIIIVNDHRHKMLIVKIMFWSRRDSGLIEIYMVYRTKTDS